MKKSLNKLVAGASALCLVAALGLASCGGGNASSEDKTITVAASPTPHAQILNEAVAPVLESRATSWKSPSSTTTCSPTPWWIRANWTPTTSSTSPT